MKTNLKFLQEVFLTCPVSGKELFFFDEPKSTEDGSLVLLMTTKENDYSWKFTISTEEV